MTRVIRSTLSAWALAIILAVPAQAFTIVVGADLSAETDDCVITLFGVHWAQAILAPGEPSFGTYSVEGQLYVLGAALLLIDANSNEALLSTPIVFTETTATRPCILPKLYKVRTESPPWNPGDRGVNRTYGCHSEI